jgi:hypothetical protein
MEQSLTMLQAVGVIVIGILVFWIPVAVYRVRGASRRWKVWVLVSWFPLLGFLIAYPAFLATLVWKGTARGTSDRRRRIWRAVACLPLINPAVMPLFVRKDRVDTAGTTIPLARLRGVTAFCSLVTLVGMGLVLVGRSTAVSVGAESRVSKSLVAYIEREREFLTGNNTARPRLCVALSGGGIRSAAFGLGVMHGLHDRRILQDVDVISAVSGGTYALSWLMLQPVYGQSATDEYLAAMFHEERFQSYLRENSTFVERAAGGVWAVYDMTLRQVFRPIIRLISEEDLGTETRKFYAWQIQNTFHGHPAKAGDKGPPILNAMAEVRTAETLRAIAIEKAAQARPTSLWLVRNVEFQTLRDFLAARRVDGRSALPYPIFNLALRARVDSAHSKQIWPHHFELTPSGLGGPALGYVAWDALRDDRFRVIRSVNMAPAISGAAISGYAQEGGSLQRAAIRFFNLDLGYDVPNFSSGDPRWIYLSDGGHAENLGVYALLQRQCGAILAVDAEHEAHATEAPPRYEFSSFTKLVTAAEKEKAARIVLNAGDPASGFDPGLPMLDGEITYASGIRAPFVYIKLALDRGRLADAPAAVQSYATAAHPRFPHDPTTNQEYEAKQFSAYESLGRHIVCNADTLQRFSSTRCQAERSFVAR